MALTQTPSRTVSPPSIQDVRHGMARALGDNFAETWGTICDRCHVPMDAEALNDNDFSRLLDGIADHNALCRVLAMSWKIRRTADRKLTELGR
ncbi:MAG: hypothetical protein ABSA91_11735 [Acidimicrobiales bacterium]